jgi:transposase-like protein
MEMSVLSKEYFHNEAAAFAFLESVLWPDGPVCPHCGNYDKVYALGGKTTRIGLKKCGTCRKQFTVKVGTVFESAHIPLHKMLQAVYLLTSSKKGISAHQLHRTLEITYKSAWFLAHRIREAMRTGGLPPMGGLGQVVEVDETFIGTKDSHKDKQNTRGYAHKHAILTLVERGGKARSFHIDNATIKTVTPIVRDNISRETALMTDEAAYYRHMESLFVSHETVNHSADEYVRGNVHTNTIEGFFSIFKRGMRGVYQHCSEKHLHRYLAKFDFRYNERGVADPARSQAALKGIVGKRLKYQTTDQTT